MAYGYPQPPYPVPYQQRSSAPASVHVVAFLFYLGGTVMLLAAAGVAALAAGVAGTPDQLPTQAADYVTAGGFIAAGILAILALLYFVFGRKLQRGRQWARVIVLILSTFAILGAVLQVVVTSEPSAAAGGVVPLLFVVLLNTGAARAWFRRRGHH